MRNEVRNMRKIALRGLIGRRRETLLLWTVVVLAFLFLALPTTLITSIEATDAAQRKATYGTWQVLASGLTADEASGLAGRAEEAAIIPLVSVSGSDYFQGDNTFLFTTCTPELTEMGQFQLREGRWPQERNEVVLEYARLVSLGLEVGDIFTVQCQLSLPMEADHANANYNAYRDLVTESALPVWESTSELFQGGDWEITREFQGRQYNFDILRIGGVGIPTTQSWETAAGQGYSEACFMLFWNSSYQRLAFLFADAEHPDGRAVPLEELTQEEFLDALRYFLTYEWPAVVETDAKRTADLLGNEELILRVNFTDGMNATAPMDLTLMYKYTVCGVIETYTDHWDSGRTDLPSGFITEENYQLLLDGQQTALEKYPFFTPVDYENMVLLGSSGDASALWRDMMGAYNESVLSKNDFTTPIFEQRAENPILGPDGRVLAYDELRSQVTFSFALADPDDPRRSGAKQVTAWLDPDGVDFSYIGDRLMDDSDGQLCNTIRGTLKDLEDANPDYMILYEAVGGGPDPKVLFDLDGQRYEISMYDFISRDFDVNGMIPVEWEKCVWLDDLEEQSEFSALRLNRLAYPSSAEGSGSLLLLVMGILFITTVCAVFQICFTQIRRRLRRVVLLKAVGAETGQIARMMAWEFIYFWIAAAPVGTALGLLSACLAAGLLGESQGRTVLLVLDPAVLAAAVLAGTVALALGMTVPALMAVGVPLTGRTMRKKPLPPPRKETMQDFFHVTLRGLAAKKGRTAGIFALCAFMMSIALLCLFLGFRMLGAYRDSVIRDGKPDYLLHSVYAMGIRQREEYLAELEELGVCGDVTSFFAGGHTSLLRPAWEGSPLITAAADVDGQPAEGYPVTLYTLPSTDPAFDRLQSAATVGNLDPDAFDQGKQVLLLIPLYRDTGKVNEDALASAEGWDRLAAAGITTSFYAEYDGFYSRDDTIQIGDPLPLQTMLTMLSEGGYSTVSYDAAPTVGAILYFFPGQGIWPFSSGEGIQVVGAPRLLSTLQPYACLSMGPQAVRAIYLQQTILSPLNGTYGSTEFYINSREDVSTEDADTALLIFARNHSMDIEVYHEGSEKLLRDAVNNILLVCLLGLTAVLLALIIFFNTITSDIEQERGRIGILQAMGVSNALLVKRQFVLGLTASAAALLLANVLLWGCAWIFAQATGSVLGNLLWGYPVWAHILLCAVLTALITLLFMIPVLRLRQYLPIENIRSKK